MRKIAGAAVLLGSVVALTATAAPAFAAGVTQPSTKPLVVPTSAAGAPYAVTVQGSGFEPGANVFVEQCDGSNPADVFWDATINCDLGSSPAPAVADASGNVTFASTDANHRFVPFRGTSPQGLFDCIASGDAATGSGNPSSSSCQVRLSTNNAASTSDQVFFTLVLPKVAPKLTCKTTGSVSFVKPLTNVAPKKPKATKIKGAGNVGTAAGQGCTNNVPTGQTKYPISSGSVKVKGAFPAGTACSVLGNPTTAGTAVTVKWQGINPKNGKLSTIGKSIAIIGNGTVAQLPTGGYVASGTITSGPLTGSTLRLQLALNGGVTGETNTCNAGSLAGAAFTTGTSSITVL